MKLVFDKSMILISDKSCNLEKFDEKEFFSVLELIVENKEKISIEKHDNITPIGERFYEIMYSELNDVMDDLD